ncbi:MAG: phosphotransferase [Candidatus Thorarchaeota archaeon]
MNNAVVSEQPLPKTIDDISLEWLEHALSNLQPALRLASFKIEQVIQGTGTKILLSIKTEGTANQTQLPNRLCLKGGYSANSDDLKREGRYINEAVFYGAVASQIDIRTPKSYFAAYDDAGQSIVIMEDLNAKGVHFCIPTVTEDAQFAADGLSQLAAMHGRWWGNEFLDSISTLNLPLPGGGHEARQREPQRWAENMRRPRGIGLPRFARDLDRMGTALDRLRPIHRNQPHCLLHGDPHLGNLYSDRENKCGFYDWQSIRRGCWAHDVNYFMVSCLDPEDRRAHEKDLLSDYLRVLEGTGAPSLSFKHAWDLYRMNSVYGLFFWTTNPVEMQAEEFNLATASRFAIAAMDHETLGLLNA